MICSHSKKKRLSQYKHITIYKCSQCQLVFSSAKDEKSFNHKTLYKNYYRNELAGRFKFGVEWIIKLFRFFRAFKIKTISPDSKSILDIGSGRGFMLYFLKKYYHYQKAIGTQIDENMLKFSRKKLGLKVYGKDLLEIPFKNNSFDIVTIWHVLEHIKDPEKYLAKIYKLLKKKGKLIIEVPNFNSWTRKLTGKYWLGLDLKYHLSFFTPISLSKMLKKHNFRIENIHTFSLEYSTFISTQSLISLITKSDQFFFSWLQNGQFKSQIIYHLLLFIFLTPICFLINIFLFFSKKGEVLLITAEK